jgi:hypothetical protein
MCSTGLIRYEPERGQGCRVDHAVVSGRGSAHHEGGTPARCAALKTTAPRPLAHAE